MAIALLILLKEWITRLWGCIYCQIIGSVYSSFILFLSGSSHMRRILSVSTCFSLLLILAGCNASNPTPLGRGYSYYNDEYKSAPGTQARSVGYDYSNERNDAVLEFMRPAAQDLAKQLDDKLSFSIDKIYLNMPANTAFYNSFDYVLRDELSQNGYMLVSSPENAVRVDLVAKNLSSRCADSGDKNIYMALAIDVIKDVPKDFVAGFYEVPLYDYREAGDVEIKVPVCE